MAHENKEPIGSIGEVERVFTKDGTFAIYQVQTQFIEAAESLVVGMSEIGIRLRVAGQEGNLTRPVFKHDSGITGVDKPGITIYLAGPMHPPTGETLLVDVSSS